MENNLTNTETSDQTNGALEITKPICEMIVKASLDVYDIRFNEKYSFFEKKEHAASYELAQFFKDSTTLVKFCIEFEFGEVDESIKHFTVWVEGYEMTKGRVSEDEAEISEHSETFLSELINYAL